MIGLGSLLVSPIPSALAAPTVTNVAPGSGPEVGGTAITVTGTGFVSGAGCTVNGVACTSVVVVNATTITAVTPAGTGANRTVRVTNPDAQFGDLASAFTYVAAPTVSALSLAVLDTAGGGQPTVVTGTGFVSGCTCTIGGTAGTVTYVNATTINVVPGARAAGSSLAVVVTNPDTQTSGTSGNGLAKYWTPAQITGIDTYFDANKGVTTSAGAVTTWVDQSANAASFTQGTGGNRPTQVANAFGTLPCIRYVQQRWVRGTSRPLVSGNSMFFVGKWTSSDASSANAGVNPPLTVIGDSGGGGGDSLGASAGLIAHCSFDGGAWNQRTRGSGLNNGSTRLIGSTHTTGGVISLYSGATVQGATFSGATYMSVVYDTLGAGYTDVDGFIGDIGAIIVVDGIISGGDLADLYAWSKQRFGAV